MVILIDCEGRGGKVPITKHVTLQWLVTRKFNIFVGFPSSVQDFFCLFFCTFNARVSGYLDLKLSICPFLAKVFQNKKNNYIRKKSLYRFIIRVLRDCQQCKICISRDILGIKLKNVGIFSFNYFNLLFGSAVTASSTPPSKRSGTPSMSSQLPSAHRQLVRYCRPHLCAADKQLSDYAHASTAVFTIYNLITYNQ